MGSDRHPSSFRDPSGFLFHRKGTLLRQVNQIYAGHYDHLLDSGLYAALTEREWLVGQKEIDLDAAVTGDAYRVLQPEVVPFVSYPYEWSFSQYQDAALLTLNIQLLALEHGMVLKDASAYNIQFIGSRPLLIDTLSFETYEEGAPWVAYRQFCQHFLAPLALISYCDVRLTSLMRTHIDGIPLDLACKLLPAKARFRFPLFSHLFLHAKSQQKKAHSQQGRNSYKVSRLALRGLVESLYKGVQRLRWELPDTEWGHYYSHTNYTAASQKHKAELVSGFLDRINPRSVWDLGANTGRFSRLASGRGIPAVAFDIDAVAAERNYREARDASDRLLLPLRLDLTNPSPGLGWAHAERQSLSERGPVDAILALALIHHLAIGNNLPLDAIASYLGGLCRYLIIEWVPKEDSQVQKLLASRDDIFVGYTLAEFERAFLSCFLVLDRSQLDGSHRQLSLLQATK